MANKRPSTPAKFEDMRFINIAMDDDLKAIAVAEREALTQEVVDAVNAGEDVLHVLDNWLIKRLVDYGKITLSVYKDNYNCILTEGRLKKGADKPINTGFLLSGFSSSVVNAVISVAVKYHHRADADLQSYDVGHKPDYQAPDFG